jgi:hypothetical protein
MTTATAAPPLPAVPLDVLDFAVQQKAAQHIRSVVEIARAVFPSSDIRLYLEADPEIAGEGRIIVDVGVTGWSAEDRLAAYNRYIDTLLRTCPPGEVGGVFCLRMR